MTPAETAREVVEAWNGMGDTRGVESLELCITAALERAKAQGVAEGLEMAAKRCEEKAEWWSHGCEGSRQQGECLALAWGIRAMKLIPKGDV